MPLRRGFTRLFVVLIVCWNLVAVWLAWQSADQSVAAARSSAYWGTLRKCNESKTAAERKALEGKLEGKKGLTTEELNELNQLDQEKSWDACEADYQKTLSEQSTWKAFKAKIADPTMILLVESAPFAAYLLCWAIAATFLWIARGFGMAGGEKN
jgi:hypothetical protein